MGSRVGGSGSGQGGGETVVIIFDDVAACARDTKFCLRSQRGNHLFSAGSMSQCFLVFRGHVQQSGCRGGPGQPGALHVHAVHRQRPAERAVQPQRQAHLRVSKTEAKHAAPLQSNSASTKSYPLRREREKQNPLRKRIFEGEFPHLRSIVTYAHQNHFNRRSLVREERGTCSRIVVGVRAKYLFIYRGSREGSGPLIQHCVIPSAVGAARTNDLPPGKKVRVPLLFHWAGAFLPHHMNTCSPAAVRRGS